jgi:hypothetical protein
MEMKCELTSLQNRFLGVPPIPDLNFTNDLKRRRTTSEHQCALGRIPDTAETACVQNLHCDHWGGPNLLRQKRPEDRQPFPLLCYLHGDSGIDSFGINKKAVRTTGIPFPSRQNNTGSESSIYVDLAFYLIFSTVGASSRYNLNEMVYEIVYVDIHRFTHRSANHDLISAVSTI